jgi:diguanylate cyclase
MGLLFIDVDHFKAVNDTHGHVTGDAVLARLASILRSSFRSSDVVARYGGEEFAVLLVDPDPDQIVAIAERVRERIARETIAGRLRVTVSIGVYISPAGDPVTTLPISTLLERADSALYKAKHGGRNRVVLYEAEPHTGLSLAS